MFLISTFLLAAALGVGFLAVYQILVRDRDPVTTRLRDLRARALAARPVLDDEAPSPVASLLATLVFGAVGAGIFLMVPDEAMLDWFRRGARAADASGEMSRIGLAFVGFEAGALLGALVGAHLGTTMFISRMFGKRTSR